MRLREIEFGSVFASSGVLNFDGKGYWYHRWLRLLRMSFARATFVAKTVTRDSRVGNMPLKSDGITPVELMPRCIVVNLQEGVALNAVGLSNYGLGAMLSRGVWRGRPDPFFISLAAVGASVGDRVREIADCAELVSQHRLGFGTPFGVELNVSCPNTEVRHEFMIDEAVRMLDALAPLNVPVMVKVNALTPIAVACALEKHSALDALDVSNTIPWGALPDQIPWRTFFGSDVSPLAHLGGGGLSGKPLLPIVIDWIKRARTAGFKKPIVGGGGILSVPDARAVLDAGANAISLGAIAFLRPLQVRPILNCLTR